MAYTVCHAAIPLRLKSVTIVTRESPIDMLPFDNSFSGLYDTIVSMLPDL